MLALLVEDDFALRELLIFLLTEIGIQVFVAHTAQEAAELAAAQPYDLWVVDLCLSGAGALELIAKAGQARSKPRLLTLHPRARPEMLAEARAQGAHAGLAMPFQVADFHQALGRACPDLKIPVRG